MSGEVQVAKLLSFTDSNLNPLTRKGQYTGHFTQCTENAKASILAATTHNQTNSHSFNLVRPRIKVFIYYYSPLCIEWSHRQKSPVKASTLRKAQNKQKEPFIVFTTWGHKIGHNSAVVGRTEFCWHPSCSSRDSASDEISVIDI